MNRLALVVSLLLPLALGIPGADGAVTPVFQYSFPASYAPSPGSDVITDLSPAGNHAVMDTLDSALVDDRPAGFDASLMSITGANGNHGATNAVDLLDNPLVEAAGGFTMDVWFKWGGNFDDSRKLVDYAGTEGLRTLGSALEFRLNSSDDIVSTPIVADTWYHAVAVFDTLGNSLYDSGDAQSPDNLDIDGMMKLYLDDVLVGSLAATLTGFGDALDRPTSLNRWAGGGGEWNQGLIFNPSVSLGVIPEPSTIVLGGLLIGFGGLGIRRRRA